MCIRDRHEPVLIHLITKKGRGYAPAEKTPQEFHGIGKFDPETGLSETVSVPTFSDIFGQELGRMAASDKTVCAITAAMPVSYTHLDVYKRQTRTAAV